MKSIDELREIGTKVKNSCFTGVHCDAVLELADEIEAEIADNYMRLPCDANGVSIHVGDSVAEEPFRPNIGEKPAEVVCMLINSDGWSIGDCDPCGHWFHPATLEHVKPRTLEDVLEDYVIEYQTRHARSEFGAEHFDHVDVHEMIKRCADEIRELLGFEIDEPDTIRNELMGGDAE